jgi:HSP20 family protein
VLDEKGGAYRIVVDLPGVDEREVDVQAHDGELQISDSAAPREVQGDVLCCEVPHRSYLRRFRLAEDVDVERISAHLEAGVLTVELPRVPAKQPKRIEVRAS